jgi:hypothetical protein
MQITLTPKKMKSKECIYCRATQQNYADSPLRPIADALAEGFRVTQAFPKHERTLIYE